MASFLRANYALAPTSFRGTPILKPSQPAPIFAARLSPLHQHFRRHRVTASAAIPVQGISLGRCPMGHDSGVASLFPSDTQHTPTLSEQIISSQIKEESTVKPYSAIPGPKGLPYVGVLFDLIGKVEQRHHLFDKWHKQYGPIMKFNICNINQVYVFDPKIVEEVFRINPTMPHRLSLEFWVKYRKERGLPLGITIAQGEEWKKIRNSVNKLLQPVMAEQQIPRLQDVSSKFTQQLARSLDSNGYSAALPTLTHHLGLESIVAVLLGNKLGLFDETMRPGEQMTIRDGFLSAVNGLFSTSSKLCFGVPIWKLWKTKLLKQNWQYWDDLFLYGNKLQNSVANEQSAYNDGVYSLIDHVRESDTLTPDEIMVTCAELIGAGVDTTANATSFALMHLARHPEVQEKLFAEISAVVGDDVNKPITAAAIRKMPYLKNTFLETIRLTPVTDTNVRLFDHDVVIGGYTIPAKTNIGLSVWSASRSANNFDDPLTFNPDRHSREGEGKQHHPYASIPFGHGARMCVGRRIATFEVQLAMANVVRQFKMEFPHEITATAKLAMTPVWDHPIKFIPRV